VTPQTPTPQMPALQMSTLQMPTLQMPTPPVLMPSSPVLTHSPQLVVFPPTPPDVDVSLDLSGDGDTVGTWPADTELVLVSGSNKVTLTNQLPLMRSVIQDAIENVRFSLLFNHAFPDAGVVLFTVRAALVAAAARSQNPRASNIHQRLLSDEEYVIKMIRLVSFVSFFMSDRPT
jgi:hypothetical protein